MKILIFIVLIVLCIADIIFLIRIQKTKPDALLNVDTRDSSKDYYDFVFLIPTGDIPKKKYLKVEVHVKS